MKPIEITSFSNEKIKFVQKLKDRKFREQSGLFVIEGYREITKAISSNTIRFHSLFISPACFLGENEWTLIERFNCPKFNIPEKVFEKISYRDRPDGLIVLAHSYNVDVHENSDWLGDFYIIIEGVEKPGNLGTILRTAEGAGVNGVIVADPVIDLFNPNVIRASTGTLFTLPVYRSRIELILTSLIKNNFTIVSVSPEAEELYFQYKYPTKIALVFGSEQYGLSSTSKKLSHQKVAIPMLGTADSLNLAMSSGILMYEIIRQRYKK